MKSEIKKILEREARKVEEAKTKSTPPQSTYDVIARCSPHLEPPTHLDPYVKMLDRAVKEGDVNCVFAAPPQHGKTQCAEHALVFAPMWDAQSGRARPRRHAYSTFNYDRAHVIANEVQQLAFVAGLDPHAASGLITLCGGAQIKFGGAVAGSLTGYPIDGIHIIDDPIKDRKEAVSRVIREDRWQWFVDVAQTRRHPGSSTVAMMTRWHQDDLSGRLISKMKWPYLRLAAECDSEDDPNGRQIGEALWPAHRPLAWLQQFKNNVVTWASMYQGSPRPLGDALFDASHCHYYDALPQSGGYRTGYGADLAYTAKTRADYSVLLRGRMYGKDLYLTDLIRRQVQADKFTDIMQAKYESERGPILWFGSTTERGVAQLIRRQIGGFQFQQATEDKYVRATPTAEHLWNEGRVLMPRLAAWVEEFEAEVCSFTGVNDPQDDQVDALAALGTLFLKGYGGKMGVGALNSQVRAKFRGGLRLVG